MRERECLGVPDERVSGPWWCGLGPCCALVLLVLGLVAPVAAATTEETLSGWRAAGGDDPRRADPGFDDSSWARVEVPASLQQQGVRLEDGCAWYRCRFETAAADGAPDSGGRALLFGPVYDTAEFFLNGVKIGAQGSLPGTWHDYAMGFRYQAVAVPAGLLRPGAGNLLAVRVLSLHSDSGMASGPVLLGAAPEMILRAEASNRPYLFTMLLSVAVFLVSGVLALGIALTRRQLGEHLWLVAFLLAMAAVYCLEHLHLLDPAVKTPLAERLANLGIAAAPVALMLHLDAAAGRTTAVWQWLLGAAAVGWGLVLLVVDMPLQAVARYWVHGIWLLLLVGAVVLTRAVQAGLRSPRESWPLLAAVGVGFSGLVVWMSGTSPFVKGIATLDLGILGMVLLLLLGFGLRTGRERHLLEEYAGGMLRAQEAERSRLAMELHDNLGQRLAVTRLRLDTGTDDAEATCRVAAGELAESMDELRTIIGDLRPTEVERVTLGRAVADLAARCAEAAGRRIEVEAPESVDLPVEAKVHVLRIVQEALQNALKHSGADHIRVSCRRGAAQVGLEVEDNGTGLAPERSRRRGLGLIGMRERARLCGGTFHVTSAAGAGTTVRVTVPAT